MKNKTRISVLDEQTINQIAAGEVVENSSSVVKELVENSIDAGASEICIETLGGGRGLVRITDNGMGMNEEELLLAIQRHATSKIVKAEDLERISTLGFRGEALPSIASIAKMTLASKAIVEIEGGKVLSVKPKEREGTQIEVRSLFFNTPVRRKFLKSIASDVASIHKILIQIALCNPSIQFKWINEGEERLFVAKGEDLESRIRALLGEEFVEKKVDASENRLRLFGFIGGNRANRTGQYLFVNKRFVVCPAIARAVQEGFATRLPAGRFPLFVLQLELPQEWVDVNVHPQKKEVRFHDQASICTFVTKSIDQALHVKPMPIRFDSIPRATYERPRDFVTSDLEFSFPEIEQEEPVASFFMPKEEQLELAPVLHSLGVIGGFLLLRNKEGIEIVDLNRARALLIKNCESKVAMQKLLLPLMLEFEEEEILEKLPFLEKYGFSLRLFGRNSFACEAIPSHIEQEEAKAVIQELLEGRASFRSLSKRRFTLEEAERLTQELFDKGLKSEATSLMTEEELAKRFKD